jgi:hypothetical protein
VQKFHAAGSAPERMAIRSFATGRDQVFTMSKSPARQGPPHLERIVNEGAPTVKRTVAENGQKTPENSAKM